jgi:hypothetical protein
MAAAAEAVTVTSRVSGLVTLVSRMILEVRAAMTPSVTHRSRHSSCESGIQA